MKREKKTNKRAKVNNTKASKASRIRAKYQREHDERKANKHKKNFLANEF